jgi:hypothetical protein
VHCGLGHSCAEPFLSPSALRRAENRK